MDPLELATALKGLQAWAEETAPEREDGGEGWTAYGPTELR